MVTVFVPEPIFAMLIDNVVPEYDQLYINPIILLEEIDRTTNSEYVPTVTEPPEP